MSSVLKGNFKTAQTVDAKPQAELNDLETRFEREALKRLGGSIVYVAKKKVKWEAEGEQE